MFSNLAGTIQGSMHDVQEYLSLSFCDSCSSEKLATHSVVREAAEWCKETPKVVSNLSRIDFDFAHLGGKRLSHTLCLDSFRNAYLVWSHYFIIENELQCFYVGQAKKSAYSLSAHGAGSIASQMAAFRFNGDECLIPKKRIYESIHVPGKTFFATADEPHNWGLWLLNTVPAVVHFMRNRRDYDHLFVYAGHQNMRDLLKLLGVQDQDVILHDCTRSYHFDEVYLFRQSMRDLYVSEENKQIYEWMRRKALGAVGAGPRGRIYLSRRKRTETMSAYRGLTNEAELEFFLQERGFNIIQPEFLSVQEQISAISCATELIGLGGAGMFNAVFCQPGTRLLDIESTGLYLNAHSNIFARCGLDYALMIGEEDSRDPRESHKQWFLDMRKAAPIIDQLLDAGTP